MRSRMSSTMIVGLLLTGPVISAQARVTGIAFEPKSPTVGHSVTAVAIDDGKHKVAEWHWSSTLSDAKARGAPAWIESDTPGRATIRLFCGGTYSVKLRVVYGGAMPPPPETVSAVLKIPRPDAIEICEGLSQPAPYRSPAIATTIRYWVLSGEATTGMDLLGTAQRRIRNCTRWDGKKDPDRSWEPDLPGLELSQIQGVIRDLVTLRMEPREWAKVASGQTIMSWDEDFRLIYIIESKSIDDDARKSLRGRSVSVECPLGTEHLSIVKLDDEHWTVRRTGRAGSSDGAKKGPKESDGDKETERTRRGEES